jgi:hypothetical protein
MALVPTKQPLSGFCWCIVEALNLGSAPVPTNGSVAGTETVIDGN